MKQLAIASALAVMLSAFCSVHTTNKGSESAHTISILYTGDLNWTTLPQLATLIKHEKPVLTVVDGKITGNLAVRQAYKGQAEIEALAAAGVNAVCLTPDLLEFGIGNVRRLMDSVAPGLFFLGANITESAKTAALGQPFIKLTRSAIRLALIGLATDSAPYRQQAGIAWQQPALAAARNLSLARMNSDIVGAVFYPASELALPGLDFMIGSKRFGTGLSSKPADVYCLELRFDGARRVVGHRTTELSLAEAEPDSAVQAIVRSHQTRADANQR